MWPGPTGRNRSGGKNSQWLWWDLTPWSLSQYSKVLITTSLQQDKPDISIESIHKISIFTPPIVKFYLSKEHKPQQQSCSSPGVHRNCCPQLYCFLCPRELGCHPMGHLPCLLSTVTIFFFIEQAGWLVHRTTCEYKVNWINLSSVILWWHLTNIFKEWFAAVHMHDSHRNIKLEVKRRMVLFTNYWMYGASGGT